MRIRDDENGWRVGERHGAYTEHSHSDLQNRDAWWDPKVESTEDARGFEVGADYGHFTSCDPGLIETQPYEVATSIHHIADAVIANSLDDDPGGSRPGPITTFVTG